MLAVMSFLSSGEVENRTPVLRDDRRMSYTLSKHASHCFSVLYINNLVLILNDQLIKKHGGNQEDFFNDAVVFILLKLHATDN